MSVSSTGTFAAKSGDRLLEGVTTQIERTVRECGTDEVHDLRVSIRRFTRILAVMKACFPRAESRRVRRALKRIMEQAGAVRNYDIAMRLVEKVEMSESLAEESAALLQQLQGGRDEAARTLTATLRRWEQRDLPANWRQAGKARKSNKPSRSEGKGTDARFRALPVDAVAKDILPDMAKDHFRVGKDASRDDASATELHQFRISAKHLRYTLDFFSPLYGASLTGLLDQLKEMQTLLGDINDCATVRHLLRHHKQEGGEASMKEIMAALKKRQKQKTEQFQKEFGPEFSSAAALRRWQESLRKTATPRRVTKAATKKSAARRASTA